MTRCPYNVGPTVSQCRQACIDVEAKCINGEVTRSVPLDQYPYQPSNCIAKPNTQALFDNEEA